MIDRIPRRKVVSSKDYNDVKCGFENLGREDVIFVNTHPMRSFQPLSWLRIKCPPRMVVILPHKRFEGERRYDNIPCVWIAEGSLDAIQKNFPDRVAFAP